MIVGLELFLDWDILKIGAGLRLVGFLAVVMKVMRELFMIGG